MADVDFQAHQRLDHVDYLSDSSLDEKLLDSDELLNAGSGTMFTLDIRNFFYSKESKLLNDVPLEGDITVPGAPQEEEEQEFNTLDEPVKVTVMRDLRAVGTKFFHVLYPKTSKSLLREWDLWGPLMLCVFLAMMLQGSTEKANDLNDGGPQFAEVFVIYWVGACVVTLNIKLLGGSISFFQSICVLGYCVLPLAVSLIICRVILVVQPQTAWLFATRLIAVMLSFGWSTFASTAFLADSQPAKRKALAMYPIFLFYFVISWLIVSHTHH